MKQIAYLFCFFSVLLYAVDEFDIDAIMKEEKKDTTSKHTVKLKKLEKDASKSFDKLKKEYYQKYEYVPPNQKNSDIRHDGFCFDYHIKNDNDRNFCLSFAKNDKKYCYSLPDRQRNICLGYCYDSSLSKADTAYCLALKNNDVSYCYNLDLRGEYKNMCQGRFNKSYCYSLNSEKDKYMCLGISLK